MMMQIGAMQRMQSHNSGCRRSRYENEIVEVKFGMPRKMRMQLKWSNDIINNAKQKTLRHKCLIVMSTLSSRPYIGLIAIFVVLFQREGNEYRSFLKSSNIFIGNWKISQWWKIDANFRKNWELVYCFITRISPHFVHLFFYSFVHLFR